MCALLRLGDDATSSTAPLSSIYDVVPSDERSITNGGGVALLPMSSSIGDGEPCMINQQVLCLG